MKMTCFGRRPQNTKCKISEHLLVRSYSNFILKLRGPNQAVQRSHMKMTCIGRRPQNTKCQILQQPLVGSYSDFNHKLRGPYQSVQRYHMKVTCIRRWLKIWNVKYFNNCWSDLTLILVRAEYVRQQSGVLLRSLLFYQEEGSLSSNFFSCAPTQIHKYEDSNQQQKIGPPLTLL